MAITAKFVADFSSFESAVKQANTKLDDLSKGATVTGGQLSKMADQFTGARLISEATKAAGFVEALGGTSKLTGAELQKVGQLASDAAAKLVALGRDVPPGIQKIADAMHETGKETEASVSEFVRGIPLVESFIAALSVERVFEFAKGILESTSRLEDLHLATGISTGDLQRLSYVGVEFGIDLEQMARGVEQLSAKLANGDKNASDAVQKLGISVSDLLAEGPKDAFLDVAEAVGRVDDPMQRAGLATELFGGKLAKVLLPALSDLRHKLEEVPQNAIISDENVTLAHDFDVKIQHLTTSLKAYSIAALEYIRNKEHQGPTTASTLNTTGISSGQGADIVLLSETTKKAIDNATLLQNKLDALRSQSLEPLTASQRANIQSLKAWGEGEAEIARDVGASAIAVHLYLQNLKETDAAAEALKKLREAAEKAFNLPSIAWQAKLSELQPVIQDNNAHIDEMAAKFDDARASIDNLTAYVNEFHDGITIAGDEIATVTIPMFSTLATGVLPQAAKAAHDFASAGPDIQRNFGDALSGSLGDISKILTHMPGAFASIASEAARTGEAIIKNLSNGNIWGAAIAGIAGVAGAFSKLFSNPEKQVNPIREAFVQLNGGLAALNEKAHEAGVTLTQMLNAKNADQYTAAINALNDAFKFQDDAMKTLDDTVAKYGFTISELGPTFAAQKLDEQAGALLQDYQVLTAAGVDHVAIINKMGPALQDYVKQAQLSGAAIPESMKPALQAMVDMGTLTDASGQAMTDLSTLTFSETLDKKFSSLIDTINKLTDAISRGLGTAIANIPDKTVHIGFEVDAPPDLGLGDQNNYAAGGGYVGSNGIQYLAGGGRVLAWKSRGSDTVPAMLTPDEGVVNQRGMKTLGKAGLASLNSGSAAGGADMGGVEDRLDAMAQQQADHQRMLPKLLRDAVLLSSRVA